MENRFLWQPTDGRFLHFVLLCSLLIAVPLSCSSQSTTASTQQPSNSPSPTSSDGNSVPYVSTSAVSGNTSNSEASSARECVLEVADDVTEELRDVFKDDNPVFVYFKLQLDGVSSTSSFYDNSSDVIDPFTWVWALEGKGQLYLSYPFDFVQLSLGTLSQGVVEFAVPVALPGDSCFQEASDDGKQQILARLVSSLVESVNVSSLNLTDVYEDKGTMVCIEKQLGPDDFELIGIYAFPICTYYVFQGSTSYQCWPGDKDVFDANPERINKHGWLGGIFALGFLLALFSPLAASFFIRRNPPIEVNGEQYLALNSDLPLGLKYLLCFSFQELKAVVAVRWFIYVVGFMLIPFIPHMVSYTIRGDDFFYRMEVAYGLLLSRGLVIFWYFLVNLIFLTIAMLFLCLYLYDDLFVPNSLLVMPADRRYFGFAFDMPPEIRVPVRPGPPSPMRGFMDAMWYRTQMGINPDIWSFWFYGMIWENIYGLIGCRSESRHWCRYFFSLIIYIVVFPIVLFIFLFLLLLNSVPLIYTLTWTIAKSLSNDVKVAEVIVALMTMFLSFAILFIFVAAFVFIAEVLAYTFIGFIVNSDFSGPVLVVVVVVAGYLISAATEFYDKYCVLLKRLIETAKEFDDEMEKQGRNDHDQSSPREGSPPDVELNMLKEQGPSHQTLLPKVAKLVEDRHGVPIIPMKLFRLVVTKYQPMYLEVASVLLQLLVIGILVAFGLSTIIYIKAVTDLPASVEFFATVVVAGVVPLLMLILKSPAKQENDDEAKASQLEADLEFYAKQGKFESMVL